MARKDIDTLLGHLGRPGRYQILIFFLLTWQYIPTSFNSLVMIVISGNPSELSCLNHNTRNFSNGTESGSCQRHLNFTFRNSIAECSKDELWQVDWPKNVSSSSVSSPLLCADCVWDYQFESASEKSIVSEFDLICEDYWQVGLSTTLVFVGMMVGGPFFGFVSDKYGRKPALLSASLCALAAGLGVTFAPSFLWFLIFRFLAGFALQGSSLCAFTMLMETFSREYRELAGVSAQLVWALGVILLAGFGYLLQNWRHLQLLITLTILVALLYPCILKESLGWLYINRRFTEAASVTSSILQFNGKKPSKQMKECAEYLKLWYQTDHDGEKIKSSICNIFTSSELRKRVFGMMYIWFTASVWYYVISFAIAEFFGNKYVNLAIAGAIDIPITVATMYLAKRFGCRLPMMYILIIGGIFAIIAGCLPPSNFALQITRSVFGQLSRGSAHAIFNIMLPYTSDLFPTAVRTNGLGLCSSALRLGGVLAPQILLLGIYTANEVPFVVCGLMGLVAAAVTYVLPETRGVRLPETVEDLEIESKSRTPRSRWAIELVN